MIISRSVLLLVSNVGEKSCRENKNTYFMFKYFFPENYAFYEITWKIFVEPCRPQTTIWRKRLACWI